MKNMPSNYKELDRLERGDTINGVTVLHKHFRQFMAGYSERTVVFDDGSVITSNSKTNYVTVVHEALERESA